MYAILAVVACCAVIPVTLAAVAWMNSLGKREKPTREDGPNDGRDPVLPRREEEGGL